MDAWVIVANASVTVANASATAGGALKIVANA